MCMAGHEKQLIENSSLIHVPRWSRKTQESPTFSIVVGVYETVCISSQNFDLLLPVKGKVELNS